MESPQLLRDERLDRPPELLRVGLPLLLLRRRNRHLLAGDLRLRTAELRHTVTPPPLHPLRPAPPPRARRLLLPGRMRPDPPAFVGEELVVDLPAAGGGSCGAGVTARHGEEGEDDGVAKEEHEAGAE